MGGLFRQRQVSYSARKYELITGAITIPLWAPANYNFKYSFQYKGLHDKLYHLRSTGKRPGRSPTECLGRAEKRSSVTFAAASLSHHGERTFNILFMNFR